MELHTLSRRILLRDGVLIAMGILLYGCTMTVTRYMPDGTPYTVEEEDWVQTLAAVFLLLLLLGVLAASAQDDDESSSLDDNESPMEDNGKIVLANAGTTRGVPILESEDIVSVVDCEGRLLATMDASEHITYHDLEGAVSLLRAAQIQQLREPVAARLRQDGFGRYRIENLICSCDRQDGDCEVLYRQIKSKLYKVTVRRAVGNSVDVQIACHTPPREHFADDGGLLAS